MNVRPLSSMVHFAQRELHIVALIFMGAGAVSGSCALILGLL